jgi:hypothetical protein
VPDCSSRLFPRILAGPVRAVNPSYNKRSPVASIDRGVLVSATWGKKKKVEAAGLLRMAIGLSAAGDALFGKAVANVGFEGGWADHEILPIHLNLSLFSDGF